MSKSLKAAIYETHGNPADVFRIVEMPWPTPTADEVVVKMKAAPINPIARERFSGAVTSAMYACGIAMLPPVMPARMRAAFTGLVGQEGCGSTRAQTHR